MGKAFLSDNQRELIKFMKHYVLYSEKRKKKRVRAKRVFTDDSQEHSNGLINVDVDTSRVSYEMSDV